MAINHIEIYKTGRAKPDITVSPVLLGSKIDLEGGSCRIELVIHTPNIVEQISYISENFPYSVFFVREQINFKERTIGDWLRGRERWYRWIQGDPEEDERYAQLDRQLIYHPFTGTEMALVPADESPGVFIKVFVVEGLKENVHREYSSRSPRFPTFKVKKVGGEQEGEAEITNLRVIIGSCDARIKEVIQARRGRGENSFSNEQKDFLRSNGLSEETIEWIARYGAVLPEYEDIKFKESRARP